MNPHERATKIRRLAAGRNACVAMQWPKKPRVEIMQWPKRPRIEVMHSYCQCIVESFLDLNSVMRLRASGHNMRAQYAPAAKPKLWGRFGGGQPVVQIISNSIEKGTMTVQGAEFLRVTFNLRAATVSNVAMEVLSNACKTNNLALAKWYIETFKIAGIYNSGIDTGKLVAIAAKGLHFDSLAWLYTVFEAAPDEGVLGKMYKKACASGDLAVVQRIRAECSQEETEDTRWLDIVFYSAEHHPEIVRWVLKAFRCDRTCINKLILECLSCHLTYPHPALLWALQEYGPGEDIECLADLWIAATGSTFSTPKPGFEIVWKYLDEDGQIYEQYDDIMAHWESKRKLR